MFKFLSTTATLFSITSALLLNSPAEAQSCPATPNVGHRCTQDVAIRARTDYPNSDTGRFSYSPPPGYRLMSYKEVVESRFGSGGNLNVDLVRGGEATRIHRAVINKNRSLSDRRSKAMSYVQWAAARVGGETETLEKAIRENNSRAALLDNSFSNIDKVNASVTVSGRCTRVVLGTCVDNEGGKYEGRVKFQLEYVGTVGTINAANDAIIRRSDAVLAELESIKQNAQQTPAQPSASTPTAPPAQPSASCPDTAPPSQASVVQAPMAFFNEWNTPVKVFIYSNGSRTSATVPPGVNHVVASAVNSNDGICFADRPGITPTGVVNRIGSIADFDTNWGDKGLFMIQNPRVK